MICFRDMTFCAATERCANSPQCHRAWTHEQRAAARRWWGSEADGRGPPVAFADFSGRDCFAPGVGTTERQPVIREDQ